LVLFLDFDGTLASIRRNPDQVWLGKGVRSVVSRLARHARVTLCLISGRRLADLRRRAPVPGARYIGLHGGERDSGEGPGREAREILRRLARRATQLLQHLPGIWVEDKGISFVVHYRDAPRASIRRARDVVRETVDLCKAHVRVLDGKKVWEVLPRAVAGKGAAVRALLAELPAPALPLYVGDDVTDESAFAALRRGITVRVGPPHPTRARFRLRDPEEVRVFLERLEREIR
jgi:trehalose 6-phosphate phosphatase